METEAVDNPRFHLLDYLRADLERQWVLLNGTSVRMPSPLRLWLRIASPRFAPVFLCRLAHYLYLLGISPAAKFVSLLNFFLFGIEIAIRCPIGQGVFFPHTQGTVIGAWRIGANATIFQGVTLGAKEVDFSYSQAGRPIVGDDVIIGSGAKILGGISVGDRVWIGANSVVLESIPAEMLAVGVPARAVEKK